MVDERNQGPKVPISMYEVCCYKFKKWRKIPTKQKFEVMRERPEDKWFCGSDPSTGRSCEQHAIIIYDSIRVWLMDRPGILRPPPKIERLVIIRGDLSKMDMYYMMPNGTRAWSHGDVKRFLKENLRYMATLPSSSFSFVVPMISRESAEGISLGRAARAKSEISEEMDVSVSDYYCLSS